MRITLFQKQTQQIVRELKSINDVLADLYENRIDEIKIGNVVLNDNYKIELEDYMIKVLESLRDDLRKIIQERIEDITKANNTYNTMDENPGKKE